MDRPRLVIAALKGASGKTVLSLGLAAHWKKEGLEVAPFKKGPDFIDAGWLSYAAGRPCYNLDPFLMERNQILESFLQQSAGASLSLVEGNRGLYDGLDRTGCCSTAELARMLEAPVVVVVDVSMSTRTVAALVRGLQVFDPELRLGGVILNRVGGPRQESLIRSAVEYYCGIPVLGAVPRARGNPFPERHMGLIPHQEQQEALKAIEWARALAREHLDTQTLRDLACSAPPLHFVPEPLSSHTADSAEEPARTLRVGFLHDLAFWFYYPENLDQLKALGATLVPLDALSAPSLPDDLDALYIGGGFPETQAEALAQNVSFRDSLRQAIERGLPVYAECGGLMYLAQELLLGEGVYPMVGALPIRCRLHKRPQGHGYTVLRVEQKNPFYPMGQLLKGHEFHYSQAEILPGASPCLVFRVNRGHGVDGNRDGFCTRNLLATYTHIHAGGDRQWAPRFLAAAMKS